MYIIGYSLESKAYRLWDPIAKKILKSRDVKFLDQFQENENKTPNTFIDVEIVNNLCDKENLPNANNEESVEEFCSAEEGTEDDIPERNEDENLEILPATKFGKGRPRIIRTGKPGRPAKRKHQIPVNEDDDSSSEENVHLANVEEREDEDDKDVDRQDSIFLEEFAGLTCIDPIDVEEALRSPDAEKWRKAMRDEIDALQSNKT